MATSERLDALLIHPSSRTQVYQGLGNSLVAIEPPVWASLMTAYLRHHGARAEVLDAEAEELGPEQVAERVRAMNPRLAVLVVYGHQPSASTQTMPAAGAVARAIKALEPDRPTIMIVGHVAALSARTLNEEACDFVAGGEGLVTLRELVALLRSDRPSEHERVPGLWYRDERGQPRATPPAPLVRDLDREMPSLPWDDLPMEKYRAHNWHCFGDLERQPYASLYTSLGCPYHCSFCCIQAPFKSGEAVLGMREGVNSYRRWSAESTVRQLDHLVERYGVRNVKFADEMFVLNPRHIAELCDLIAERRYGLNIWAYARVDTVREGMLDKLVAAGVRWLAFGLESGSERVLAQVDKRFETDQMYDTLRRVREAGINVVGNYIFGLPEDDRASMQETLDLAVDLNCEWANFYSAMAYPGSKLYQEAVEQGWQLPESWSGYSQHSVDTLPLPTRHVSAAEVLRFRDRAFDAYFGGARYQSMVERKFGPETRAHVQEMLGHRLVRKNA
jgi:anaerobic magnesium-protoporphyrin IX monomethyl ester cyclase